MEMESSNVNGNHLENDLADDSMQRNDQDLLFHPTIEHYYKFCNNSGISNNVRQRAYHYLRDLISQQIQEIKPEIKNVEWFASVIYMALIDIRLPYGPSDPHLELGPLEPPGMTVTDILLKADININQLFRTLQIIKSEMSVSDTIKKHLIQMERNYCVVSALFHSFQSRLCPSVFREDNKNDCAEDSFLPPIPETEGVAFRQKQCWVLFLLSKYHLLPDNQELFQHFQLLLCCLEFVLRQTPSFLLNSPYDSIRFGCFTQEQGQTMLGKLAEDFEVAPDETLQLHKERTEPFFQTLLNKDGELDSDGLCEEYEKIYHKEGDLNELLFLKKDSRLLPLQVNRVQQSNGHSRLAPEQMTPVRVAVSTVQALQDNFANVAEEPSERLRSYFEKCTRDPGENIKKIIANLKKIFIQEYEAITPQSTVAEQRFSLGVKLYFKVLETMMDTESSKIPPQVLSDLLNKENFHKSLLACAIEVVLTTYSQSWNHSTGELTTDGTSYSFPWILDVFTLQAYDFCKVIESFIKAEPRLPVDVVKHLRAMDFKILDSLAWKENSPVFDMLGFSWDMGQMTPPIPASPVKSQDGTIYSPAVGSNGHSVNAMELFMSPVRPSMQSSISAATTLPSSLFPSSSLSSTVTSSPSKYTDPPTNPVIEDVPACKLPTPPRSQSLSHFLNKVCRLGFSRMTKLCSYLDVPRDLQHKIWTCFEYCVKKLPKLLQNRHLDQIIMCCIYGICKVTEQELRFKSIVSEYRNLLHARQEVYKEVYISQEKHDSIINFYNHIFMQNIKSYILQFSPNRPERPQLSPMPKQSQASPSYSLPGKPNFKISPLKESPFKAPPSPSQMTPRSRMLLSFGDSIGSGDKFKDINERMNGFNARRVGGQGPASAKKRLNMDDLTVPTKAKKIIL